MIKRFTALIYFLLNCTLFLHAQDRIVEKEVTGYIMFTINEEPIFFEDSCCSLNLQELSENIGISLKGMPIDEYLRVRKSAKGIVVKSSNNKSRTLFLTRVSLSCNYNANVTKKDGTSAIEFEYYDKFYIMEYYTFLLGTCEEIHILPLCFDYTCELCSESKKIDK